MRPAVFLDRDGTLNREQGFVTAPDQVQLLPQAGESLARLRDAGYRLVVLTNQSGIARGLYSESDLARIHAHMTHLLECAPEAWLHCPHFPDATGPYGGPCPCRKPESGLLHRAADLFDLELARSVVVGDSARDVLMARDLPVRTVLVQSGKPWQEELAKLAEDEKPDVVVPDLPAATDWILAQLS